MHMYIPSQLLYYDCLVRPGKSDGRDVLDIQFHPTVATRMIGACGRSSRCRVALA